MSDIATSDFAADDGAGDDFSLVNDRRKNDDVEATLGAEQKKHAGVAGLFVAEAEIFSDKNGAHLKIADEDLVDKFLWGELCKVEGEGKNDGGVHANRGEAAKALLGGGKAQWGGLRAQNFLRKGIKR